METITLRAVHAAGDYASAVCVHPPYDVTSQATFTEENASQARIFSTYHGESANIELRTLQKA